MTFNLWELSAVGLVGLIGVANRFIYKRWCNPRIAAPFTIGSPGADWRARLRVAHRGLAALPRERIAYVNQPHAQVWWICNEERPDPPAVLSQKTHWVKAEAGSIESIYGDVLPARVREYCQRYRRYLHNHAWEIGVVERDLGGIAELEMTSLMRWSEATARRREPELMEIKVTDESAPLPGVMVLFRQREESRLHLIWHSSLLYRPHFSFICRKLSKLIHFEHAVYALTPNDLACAGPRLEVACVLSFSPAEGRVCLVGRITAGSHVMELPTHGPPAELLMALNGEITAANPA